MSSSRFHSQDNALDPAATIRDLIIKAIDDYEDTYSVPKLPLHHTKGKGLLGPGPLAIVIMNGHSVRINRVWRKVSGSDSSRAKSSIPSSTSSARAGLSHALPKLAGPDLSLPLHTLASSSPPSLQLKKAIDNGFNSSWFSLAVVPSSSVLLCINPLWLLQRTQ